MSALDSLRQFIEFFRVTAAEHHVIGNERFFQLDKRVLDVAPPTLFAMPRHAGLSKTVFNDAAVTIRKIPQFQRENIIAPHQGCAQACAEPDKNHSASGITTVRLHGGVAADAEGLAVY